MYDDGYCSMGPRGCFYSYMYHVIDVGTDVVVKPGKNSIFLKKGKMVISVEHRKFSRSRMTKRTASLYSSREI